MAKLKVYRTPIGFHDAYVAAASQKAALAAWGSDRNLFAHGAAEIVTDPALTAAPLASPGTVIKRLRGTADEQLAALPPDRPKARRGKPKEASKVEAVATPPNPPPPPPSRRALEQADAALEAFDDRARRDLDDLHRREAALAAERRSLLAAQERERAALDKARQAAATAYDRAMKAWRQDR